MGFLVRGLLLLAFVPATVWGEPARPGLARPGLAHAGSAARGSAGKASAHQGSVRQAAPRDAGAAPGATDAAVLCETAVITAEYMHRVPPRLLGAISLTETGRPDPATGQMRPWPWTINANDEGHFYATKQDAIAAVKALQARGVQSIDVGCMQVNLMYHPTAFASLDEAFDPKVNADYAARFLNQLYAASHAWPAAVGAYHSETPELGDAYRVLVLARWQGDVASPATEPRSPYQDFLPRSTVYGAFANTGAVYGAFAPR